MIKDEINLNAVVDTLEVNNISNLWGVTVDRGGMTKEKKIFNSRIDTVGVKINVDNLMDKDIDFDSSTGIKKNGGDENVRRYIYNPNRYDDIYSHDYKLTKTKEGMDRLMIMNTVINPKEVFKTRIDICTDIDMDYYENFKLLNMLHKCFTYSLYSKSHGRTSTFIKKNDKTLHENGIVLKNDDYFVEYYDKKDESNGRHLYDTRLEVRLLRIKKQEFEYHIDKCVNLYKATEENFEVVEKLQSEILKTEYDYYIANNPSATFREFVAKENNSILTMENLRAVYEHANMKGSLRKWLTRYRQGHDLKLVTKTEIKNMAKDVIRSLKEYKKS